MADTSLEVKCSHCDNIFWYEGAKKNPNTVECPECSQETLIPEDG